jgi:hypothetical protein
MQNKKVFYVFNTRAIKVNIYSQLELSIVISGGVGFQNGPHICRQTASSCDVLLHAMPSPSLLFVDGTKISTYVLLM